MKDWERNEGNYQEAKRRLHEFQKFFDTAKAKFDEEDRQKKGRDDKEAAETKAKARKTAETSRKADIAAKGQAVTAATNILNTLKTATASAKTAYDAAVSAGDKTA